MKSQHVFSEGFSGPFLGLNGYTSLSATRADIIRSMVTVGYPSKRAAVAVAGPWRARMLTAMVKGYLDPWLKTTAYFRALEQSEKVGVSFLLGEAFTHWFAQSRMGIPHLAHVAGVPSCVWGGPSAHTPPKAGAATPAPKSRPDFIGIHRDERHVFESKGRERRPSDAVAGKALGQASALRSVDGKSPTTRNACFFMFKASGAEGKVIDPPSDKDGIGVKFDTLEAIQRAYAFFLDQRETLRALDRPGYVGREIDDQTTFGIDVKVLAAVSESITTPRLRQERVLEIYDILEGRAQDYEQSADRQASIGIDGTMLVSSGEPRIRRRTPVKI